MVRTQPSVNHFSLHYVCVAFGEKSFSFITGGKKSRKTLSSVAAAYKRNRKERESCRRVTIYIFSSRSPNTMRQNTQNENRKNNFSCFSFKQIARSSLQETVFIATYLYQFTAHSNQKSLVPALNHVSAVSYQAHVAGTKTTYDPEFRLLPLPPPTVNLKNILMISILQFEGVSLGCHSKQTLNQGLEKNGFGRRISSSDLYAG